MQFIILRIKQKLKIWSLSNLYGQETYEMQLHFSAPAGQNEIKEIEVYNFTGDGGVALSMYNTDEVCNWVMPFLQVSL